MKNILYVLILTLLTTSAFASRKIQNEDVKTLSDITGAGGTVSQLINDTKIYVSANGINKQLSSAITAGQIGGGGSGSVNYLTAYTASTSGGSANTGNGDFELGSTTGWSLAHVAFSTANGYFLPTGVATAGSAFSSSSGGTSANANLSLTATTTTPLQKSYSGNLVSSTASTQGDLLVSNAFYIDSADQAKMMTVSFSYQAMSGTFDFSGTSTNTFAVWVYDVTNAQWIMPAGAYNTVQRTGIGKATQITFQTTSNSTQYQLALININATAGAYSFYVDNFSVGPQVQVSGPAMTDWVAYTPTFTGFGTPSNVYFYSRRVGDKLEVMGSFETGTTTGSVASFTLGYAGGNANVSTDITKIPAVASGMNVQVGSYSYNVTSPSNPILASGQTTQNALYFGVVTASNPIAPATGSSVSGAGNYISFFASVPIVGWSSNSAMSSDTDTKVIASNYYSTATPTLSGGGVLINFDTKVFDQSAAVTTGGSWKYVAPTSGFYSINSQIVADSATTQDSLEVDLYKNGVYTNIRGLTFRPATATNQRYVAVLNTGIQLNAGDYIQIYASSATGNRTLSGIGEDNYIYVNRLSGPAVVTANEKVSCRYAGNSGQSLSSSSIIMVTPTKQWDSHGIYNTSTGVITLPRTGKFQIAASSWVQTTATSGGQNLAMEVHTGSVANSGTILGYTRDFVTSGAYPNIYPVIANVSGNAGDTFTVQIWSDIGSSRSIYTGASETWIQVNSID